MTAPADERARLRALAEQWQRKLQSVQPGDASAYMRALSPDVVLRLLDDVGRLTGEVEAWSEMAEVHGQDAQRERARAERLAAENLSRGNALGRIAAHLLGQQNNVSDESVVAAAAEVGRALQGSRLRAERLEAELFAARTRFGDAIAEPAPGGQDAEREGGA